MRALELFVAAFGEAREVQVENGYLYRWVFHRPDKSTVYITLDSPELPDLAHVMISDPAASAIAPITSVIMRTLPEVEAAIESIRTQLSKAGR
jgi:hypothetical protein